MSRSTCCGDEELCPPGGLVVLCDSIPEYFHCVSIKKTAAKVEFSAEKNEIVFYILSIFVPPKKIGKKIFMDKTLTEQEDCPAAQELDLLLRTGQLLVESAADTNRVVRNLNRVAGLSGAAGRKAPHRRKVIPCWW